MSSVGAKWRVILRPAGRAVRWPLRRYSRVMLAGSLFLPRRSTLWLMAEAEIQYVSDESGEPTAVIVPISLWREIESERETAYLLKSEAMKQRLLEAKESRDGIAFEAALEKLGIRHESL